MKRPGISRAFSVVIVATLLVAFGVVEFWVQNNGISTSNESTSVTGTSSQESIAASTNNSTSSTGVSQRGATSSAESTITVTNSSYTNSTESTITVTSSSYTNSTESVQVISEQNALIIAFGANYTTSSINFTVSGLGLYVYLTNASEGNGNTTWIRWNNQTGLPTQPLDAIPSGAIPLGDGSLSSLFLLLGV